MTSNRLKDEASPYLLQHADNPVDWYPWGEEAFAKAKSEDKPIFLSIGYSTCHWCHVMAHESFEDAEVAQLMNEAFVCIKVDREERPDIDGIYMTTVQLLNGNGGWPLTIVMTADKKPFFGGTYFPKTTRFGRVGMTDLVPRLSEVWQTRRAEVLNTADSLSRAIGEAVKGGAGFELSEETLELAYKQLMSRYDQTYGGFSERPKFPTPHNLLFLLRYYARTKETKALQSVCRTLKAMRAGGLFDQVGFGFHRYSTDREWLLPHFEKMLYDQALLAIAYTEAYQITAEEIFKETAQEIFEYVLRDLQASEGAFHSAEDADSEGEEGKFYVWTEAEIIECLGQTEGERICQLLNTRPEGNFADEASGERNDNNILHFKLDQNLSPEDNSLWQKARLKLLEKRKNRVRPSKDDKVLTDWNALLIVAFAKAGRTFTEARFLAVAEKALNFIFSNLQAEGGNLFHSYRAGKFIKEAFIDDYAFLVWACLELYQSTFEVKHLKKALELTEYALANFWDEKNGGFFFSAAGGEKLLARQKEIYDGAIPSGNSVFALNLLHLSKLTGNLGYTEKAFEITKAFSENVANHPSAYCMLMTALDFALSQTQEITIVCESPDDEMAQAMLKAIRSKHLPNTVVLLKTNANASELEAISELARGREAINKKTTAYLCVNGSCKEPIQTLDGLKSALGLL